MFNNYNSHSSIFSRSIVDKPHIKPENVNIDLLPSVSEKLKALSNRKEQKQKAKVPGKALLKKLYKEQHKKKVIKDSDSDDNSDDEIDKYTKSINNVMDRLNL